MNKKMNLNKQLLKQFTALLFAAGVGVFAFASIGDGKDKSKSSRPSKSAFVPIKTNAGFTLKSGLNYKGSMLSTAVKSKKGLGYNHSLITYQKGNTTYILPYRSNKTLLGNKQQLKSNLQAFSLKLNIIR